MHKSNTKKFTGWTLFKILLVIVAIVVGIGFFAFEQEYRIYKDNSRGEEVLLNSGTEAEYTNRIHNYKIRYPAKYQLINSKDGTYGYNPDQSTKDNFSEGDIMLIERQEENWAQYTIFVPPIKNSKPFQENLSKIREGIESLASQHGVSITEREVTVGTDRIKGTEFSLAFLLSAQ